MTCLECGCCNVEWQECWACQEEAPPCMFCRGNGGWFKCAGGCVDGVHAVSEMTLRGD